MAINFILGFIGLVLAIATTFIAVTFLISYGRTLKRIDGLEKFCLKHMNLEIKLARLTEQLNDHERRLSN